MAGHSRVRGVEGGPGVRVARVRQWAPLAAVVGLLGAAMLATLFANPQIALAPPFLSGVDTTGAEQTGPPVSVSVSRFAAGPEKHK